MRFIENIIYLCLQNSLFLNMEKQKNKPNQI